MLQSLFYVGELRKTERLSKLLTVPQLVRGDTHFGSRPRVLVYGFSFLKDCGEK